MKGVKKCIIKMALEWENMTFLIYKYQNDYDIIHYVLYRDI